MWKSLESARVLGDVCEGRYRSAEEYGFDKDSTSPVIDDTPADILEKQICDNNDFSKNEEYESNIKTGLIFAGFPKKLDQCQSVWPNKERSRIEKYVKYFGNGIRKYNLTDDAREVQYADQTMWDDIRKHKRNYSFREINDAIQNARFKHGCDVVFGHSNVFNEIFGFNPLNGAIIRKHDTIYVRHFPSICNQKKQSQKKGLFNPSILKEYKYITFFTEKFTEVCKSIMKGRVVACSPLKRTWETACVMARLAELDELTIFVLPQLQEIGSRKMGAISQLLDEWSSSCNLLKDEQLQDIIDEVKTSTGMKNLNIKIISS